LPLGGLESDGRKENTNHIDVRKNLQYPGDECLEEQAGPIAWDGKKKKGNSEWEDKWKKRGKEVSLPGMSPARGSLPLVSTEIKV